MPRFDFVLVVAPVNGRVFISFRQSTPPGQIVGQILDVLHSLAIESRVLRRLAEGGQSHQASNVRLTFSMKAARCAGLE